jgi:hypothetical protein
VRLESLQKALLLGKHSLLAHESRLLIGFADRAFAFLEIIVAGVGDDFASIDFGNARDNAIHELAIMRGHQERTGVALQEFFEPDDGFDVGGGSWANPNPSPATNQIKVARVSQRNTNAQ